MQVTNASGNSTIGGIWDMLQTAQDSMTQSLFQYNRRSVISSRVFIERNLVDEDILTPLMLNIMNLYAGLIMTAMDMNQYITSTRKVRDAMSVVATEDFKLPQKDTIAEMNQFFMGNNPKMYITRSDGTDIYQDVEPTKYGNPSGATIIDPEPKNANLPSGRIIEINFGTNKDNDQSNRFTVNLFLQLLPYFIPTDVAQQFVAMNFSPSIRQRWMQVSAGEISFIKDFLLGQDMRKKRSKAMRQDRTGALKEMEDRRENSLANFWLKLTMVTPERQNIANTILIFDKTNFDKACSQAGLKFKDYYQRQKFFNKTFVMMLCTIDPMYNKIAMYYHGLEAVSNFTFDQVKRNSKTEAVDLMKIMDNYAKGMAPRF